jgi:hypothetical protein
MPVNGLSQIQKREKITAEVVRELLHYNPRTGLFKWKRRARKWFVRDRIRKAWNTRYAGQPALTALNIDGYLHEGILGRSLRASRVAFLYMKGRWPEPECDHINGIPTDNRWCNLREATRSQQMINRGCMTTNTSGLKGELASGLEWRYRSRWSCLHLS